MSSTPIRVAVVGVGSFGKNHARVYHALQSGAAHSPAVELVGVVDQNIDLARTVASEFSTRAFPTIKDLLAVTKIDAASVAVPTVAHLDAASALMQAGVDVLIEKPLTPALHHADELIRLASRTSRIAQVGHLERFNPAVRATLPIITKPMFFEVHRLSPFTPRSLDVDVVLDLMIHDLDVVLSLVNSPIKEVRAVGLPVLTNKVDIANVRMEFDSGCVANFTASRVSTERVRKLRFFQPHQYVSLDYSRKDVFVLTVNQTAEPASQPGAPFAMPDIVPSRPEVVPEEPLLAEIKSFLHSVSTRTRPVVTLEDGRRALAAALDILSSIEKHSRMAKLDRLTNPPAVTS